MGIVVFDGLAFGALLFLISVGLSVTMGLMNFVNLAHGAFAMAGGYAAAVLMNDYGAPFPVGLAAGFLAGAVTGGVMEFFFIRRLYRSHPLDQVLFTIGLVFASIATVTFFFGPTMQRFVMPSYLDGNVALFGTDVSRYRLFLIVVGVIVVGGLLLGLNRTRFGAMIRASVDNQRVAQGSGINVDRLFLLTFTFGCGLAGFGGALSLGMLTLNPIFPLKYMVYFLMVVCVGGAGTITGPFLAALLVGVGDVAGKYYIPESGGFLIYLLMLGLLLARPRGLVVKQGAH
ncbi:branched-chain amino acid ABC transporter permease [Amorphus orientalis]|uniref:Branched-chain amino acid transport system permease protein n=1 Tax=Amorphus orientalis TaxID=649198 RepID=A0AAE4AS46_9HYPH|nr:branched-chain amino acid ABC transporter permease [Amorphus orientalis]MDQ0314712.1 branched-chain amino acid transport system permease protein [Amorphus orientalis]